MSEEEIQFDIDEMTEEVMKMAKHHGITTDEIIDRVRVELKARPDND